MVLEFARPGPCYTPYLLARAVRTVWPQAKVLLCGEGADEFFLGYQVHLDPWRFASGASASARNQPPSARQSELLERIAAWEERTLQEVWFDLIHVFQSDQLVNGHLVPFDHGPMAYGLECRVPFLDTGLLRWVQAIPPDVRLLGDTSKMLLRILLAELLPANDTLARALLSRPKQAAFGATAGCGRRLQSLVRRRLRTGALRWPELARYSRGLEDLFWLASTVCVFVEHRGQIAGMSFMDLMDEVIVGGDR